MVEKEDIPEARKALNELASWVLGEAKTATIQAYEATRKVPPDISTAVSRVEDLGRFSEILKNLTTAEKNIAEGFGKHPITESHRGHSTCLALVAMGVGLLIILMGSKFKP